MSIFETIFGAKPAPAANPAVNPATQPPAQPQNFVAANPTVPSAASVPAQNPVEGQVAAPLGNYDKLWEPTPAPTPEQQAAQQKRSGLNPQQLAEAASQVDFSKVLPQEVMAKIQAGGADAVQATIQAMNAMSQATYAQSSHAANQMIEARMAEAQKQFMAQIPTLVKQASARDALRTENPLYSNPAVAPIMNALEQQFTRKYPNATTQEITSHAREYLGGLAEVITTSQTPKVEPSKVKGETDWSKYLGG